MRLLAAELLKIRRRTATWVVLGLIVVLTLLIQALSAPSAEMLGAAVSFPEAWRGIGDYPFGGLGTMLAVAYAAALAGADWNWGVLRNIIARGESRTLYVLIKALALAIVLAIAALLLMAIGFAFTLLLALLADRSIGDPFSAAGLAALRDQLLLGYPVLLERAAIGFAVAVTLRSQLAGVIVGIVFFIGESIVRTTLTLTAIGAGGLGGVFGQGDRLPPQWFQYLPFGIGDEVRAAAIGQGNPLEGGDFIGLFLTRVPLLEALLVLGIYVAVALGISVVRAQREEIVA
jgi:ABC-type transport system involved in multi-copper enzyme maturation permease subunit